MINESLEQRIVENESKQIYNEASMATLMKLIRIQYALCHQDEKDKQDIFLMGGRMEESPTRLNDTGMESAFTTGFNHNL